MRAQASMEYLILIGFILALVVPLIAVFYSKSSETTTQVNTQQAHALGQKIADTAESVYYLGQPSKLEFRANVPDNINSVTFTNKAIIFVMDVSPGTTDIVVPTTVNLTGTMSITPGVHMITVENRGGYVFVNST
ncbi:hypothetical protein HY492_02910 [Candidatus Woesearchaeota archaeon]|nr:hypothetical protein [Candidatus Woesearchaeota archaeon]